MRFRAPCLLLAFTAAFATPLRAGARDGWTAAWASSQMIPADDQVVPAEWLDHATLREMMRDGLAGRRRRLRLSNAFGTEPLAIGGVTIARSADLRTPRISGDAIALRFGGRPDTVIPAGADLWSDPDDLAVAPGSDLTVSLYLPKAPTPPPGHPGSRATTYFVHGNHVAAADLVAAQSAPRWLIVSGIEVLAPKARAIAVFGDSITDGYGVQPDTNLRWTDHLAARLRADPKFGAVAVLNEGLGGNRLLSDGLGPNALARFGRDVLSQPGVTP